MNCHYIGSKGGWLPKDPIAPTLTGSAINATGWRRTTDMVQGAMDGGGMVVVAQSLWQRCLQGLDEEVRSLPGYAWRVGWQIKLTTGERTQSWVVDMPFLISIWPEVISDTMLSAALAPERYLRPRWAWRVTRNCFGRSA